MQSTLFEREADKLDRMRPLRPRQLQAVTAIREAIREGHRRIILQAPTGFGKCLGRGTPVLMLDGTIVPVESIVKGDLLMGPDSKPRRVLSTTKGVGPLYRVTPVKGDPYICNDVHILSLKRTNLQTRDDKVRSDCQDGAIVNIPLNEYIGKSKTFKHIHKGWRTGVRFQSIHVPFDPYFLGVWLGDGNSREIGITTVDPEIVILCEKVAADYGLKIRVGRGTEDSPRCPTYHLAAERGQRNPLWTRFKNLGLHKGKHVPLLYKANSAYVRRNVLAGLIDTDGHMIPRGGCDLVFKSRVLADDACFLARSLGLAAYIKECRKTCVNNGVEGTYYRVGISGDLTRLPMRLPRKKALAWKQKKDVLITGIKVEPIGEGEYFGFSIDGDRLFMLGDFTVTHNTLTSAHIIAAALRKGSRPLFTCPAISLVDQTLASFEAEGIRDIGVIQAQHPRTNLNAAVQIASVQTLIRRGCPDVGFALVDEVHEEFDGLDALLDSPEWKNKIVIGLSATPWARGMGLRWTELIIAGTINDMIAEGHACPAIVYAPEHDLNREEIAVSKGEFEDKSAGDAMSDAKIIGDVLKEWREKSPRGKTFAFCVNRDHARAQMEAFQDAGIPFGYIDANVDVEERKRIFAQMRYGEIAGVASVGCLIRGVDEDVRCILDLQPTKSEMRHVQKWGRGVRMADGKTHLLGLDHAGNNAALGLFTDIFHDTLDTRKPGERGEAYKDDYKPAKPRKCHKCHNLVPPGVRECPACKERLLLQPGVTVKDGRLVEIGSGPKKAKPDPEKQRWYSELLHVGRKAGFKDGWAAFKFREKFGAMPDGLKPRGKSETSDDVKAFVRKQRAMYLASKRRDDASQAVQANG